MCNPCPPLAPCWYGRQLTDELQATSARPATGGAAPLLGRTMDEIERYYITETLKLTGGNREDAARMLGIGERTLYRRIKEWEPPE